MTAKTVILAAKKIEISRKILVYFVLGPTPDSDVHAVWYLNI